jgi:hypothetical protein
MTIYCRFGQDLGALDALGACSHARRDPSLVVIVRQEETTRFPSIYAPRIPALKKEVPYRFYEQSPAAQRRLTLLVCAFSMARDCL